MSNMSEDIQYAGSDTRPLMLDRTDFESWQQRIRLYCLGKDNGENIMKSIIEGPFQMGTIRETLTEGVEGALNLGPERDRVFTDLTLEEKDRYKADIRVTNILLQGLLKDIYALINHYTDAKDIWDNVKMLLEGSELTKDDRESQLYDDFEHFRQNKGENIHSYYVRFITEVKLNRGLKESNFDQLYAYLKQHEVHANENKMMLDRLSTDSEALQLKHDRSTSNQHTYPPYTVVHKHIFPQTNNQLRRLLIKDKATVQDCRVLEVIPRDGNVNPGPKQNPICVTTLQGNRAHSTELLDEEQVVCLLQENMSPIFDVHVMIGTQSGPNSEISEITRKRMLEKMKSPLCVENKIKIGPPDYSKENLLATFAPQRNLTPEQIFWSIDENDRKKAETSVPKPLSALTVYPPNTPLPAVSPIVIPTKVSEEYS
ncbi:hypothetical protein Tco_1314986 [Tanacetum coccineum]